MMDIKEKIKYYYQKGYYKKAHLEGFLRAGVIDQKTVSEILLTV